MTNAIYLKYSKRVLSCGGDTILPRELCMDFVSECKRQGVAILGIEGFKIHTGGKVFPLLNDIADFSSLASSNWSLYVEQSCHAAEGFLKSSSPGADGYSFVLDFPAS